MANRTIEAAWLRDDDLAEVLAALTREGARARFVGGCVRNALLGEAATDIDVAIDRPPEETIRLLETAGLKAAPTGVEHGTVTAVTRRDHTPVEVTSLRRDVETDGRRAVVAFTSDWAEDAMRRDFTMNALYADADGLVFDPLGAGLADLAARRVRFIGRAEDRIREDALRILRFFRFFARYAAPGSASADDLAAIAALKDLVKNLARERIGQEIRKLLAAPDPAAAVALGLATGALQAAFEPLPPPVFAAFPTLLTLEANHDAAPDALRRLALLSAAAPTALADRFRLSKSEQKRLDDIFRAQWAPASEAGYRFGREAARDAAFVVAALRADGRPDPTSILGGAGALADALRDIDLGAAQTAPVAARDLISIGFAPGPMLGKILKDLEQEWIESKFTLEKDALLALAAAKKGEIS